MNPILRFFSKNRFWQVSKQLNPKTKSLSRIILFVLLISFLSGKTFAQYGALDCTFGNNGLATINLSASSNTAQAIAVFDNGTSMDGKIAVAGNYYDGTNSQFGVAIFNEDGTPYTAFNGSGWNWTSFQADKFSSAKGIVIQSDDKVVVAGIGLNQPAADLFTNTDQLAMARFNTDGTLDATFGSSGKVFISLGPTNNRNDEIYDMVVDASDNIYVAGGKWTNGSTFQRAAVVYKTNSDGNNGQQFVVDFIPTATVFDSPDIEEAFYGLTVYDGNIYATGYCELTKDGDKVWCVAKMSTSGELDNSFGSNGKVTINPTAGQADWAYDVGVQSDGTVVVMGEANNDFAVVKLNASGVVQSTYTFEINGTDDCKGGVVLPDDKILLYGNNSSNLAFLRLNADATLDNTFGSSGEKIVDHQSRADYVYDATIQSDGKIVSAGSWSNPEGTTEFAVTRLIVSDLAMTYCSGDVVQQTGEILKGYDGEILKIKISVGGNLTPESVTQMNFTTVGSTDATTDIASAKLYYTGTSDTYAQTTQFGSTVSSPNGSFAFNGSQELSSGTNYFWLVYTTNASATEANVVDAVCTNYTLTSGTYVPANNNPTGNREVADPHYPYITSFTPSDNAYNWITNVTFGTINNSTGKSTDANSNADGYTDYSGSVSTTVNAGVGYTMSVTFESTGGYGEYVRAYFDWNSDYDFTDVGEEIIIASANASTGSVTVSKAITIPAEALGAVRLRLTCDNNAAYGGSVTGGNIDYGEAEDYTVNVVGPPTVPSLTTEAVSNISTTSATGNGNITDLGGANITERGVFYSTTEGFADGTGTKVSTTGSWTTTGSFTQSITGLSPNTTYYAKAFATNSAGVAYGGVKSFTTTPLDTIKPTLTVPADIHVYADADQCGTVVDFEKDALDAKNEDVNMGFVTSMHWQSFKPEKSGSLTKISIKLWSQDVAYTLKVYKGVGIDGELLYSGNYSKSNVADAWRDLDLPLENAPLLIAGNDYTFCLTGADMRIWTSFNSYSDGAYYSPPYGVKYDMDLTFRTYIIEPWATDNSGAVDVSQTQGLSSGSVFPVGETINTFVATDAAGNKTEKSFKVIVEDNTNPIALAHDTIIYLDANGLATLKTLDINNGSSDNCGIDTMYLSQYSFNSDDLGTIDDTLTVVDIHGNEAFKSAVVTVSDTISPTLNVPADISVYADANQCGTVVNYEREVLDIDSEEHYSGFIFPMQWQSFKPEKSGALTKISIRQNSQQVAAFTLTVYNGVGIDGELLYSGNYSINNDPDIWQNLDLPLENAPLLIAGNDYTFCLTGDDISIIVSGNDYYPDGSYYCSKYGANPDWDLCFRTYITEGVFATDNTGSVELKQVIGLSSGSVFPVGETTNTFVATDATGNKTEKSFKVVVEDTMAPVVIVLDTTLYLNADGLATISVESIDAGSYDNCEIDTMYLSQDTFDCSYVGYISADNSIGLKSAEKLRSGGFDVSLTVEDLSGNSNSDLFYVTVLDTVSPEVKTKDITVYLDESGMVVLDSLAVDNGSADACGLAGFELSRDTFYCENVGENIVTMTVTDMHGNSSSATAQVTVADEMRPTVLAHDTTLYLNADGIAAISVESIDAGSYDNCSIDTMYLSQDTFDCSYVGYIPADNSIGLKSTKDRRLEGVPVELTVEDVNGNTNTNWFYVTVLDTISPQVKTKDIIVFLDESGMVVLDSAAVDNGSSDACGLAGFELSRDTFYCENVGEHIVTMTVTDIHGNVSTATASVTVADEMSPTVLARDTTLYLNAEGIATISVESVDAGSYDNCSIDTMYLSQDTFDCSYVGYIPADNSIGLKSTNGRRPDGFGVWLTATDVNGNTNQDLFYVTVKDTISPEVQTKDIVVSLGEDGVKTISPSMIVEDSYDACGIESMELSKTIFKGTDVGVNTIVLTATDVNGNKSFVTSTVTVLDTIAPEVWCQNFSIVLDQEGSARIYPAFATDSVYDAGGIASYNLDKTRFNCTDLGQNTVTLTVKDYGGNVASCTSTVTIVDRFAPEVLCNDIEVVLGEDGVAAIDVSMLEQSSEDECGVVEKYLSQSVFTGADLGANKVTLYVADESGNVGTCESTVTVIDEIAPVTNCNSIGVELTSGTSYELTAEDIAALTAGSSDNATASDSLTIEITPNSFSCANIGDSVAVSVSITDKAGNESSCETKVFVSYSADNNLEDILVELPAGVCETTIDYPAVFTGESCATLTLLKGLGADSLFPVGTTIETWEVALGGVTDTVSFSVTVTSENAEPTLDSVADATVAEDEQLTVQLSGISDGGDCTTQALYVTATTEDTDLIQGIDVVYTSPDSTAELSITPVANQYGEAEVVVTVEDEDGAVVRDTFKVTVTPVNDAPELLVPIADLEIKAETTEELEISKDLGVMFDDADNDELTWMFSIEGTDTVPSWISVAETAETYKLGFSPSAADTGCYSLIVGVSDPSGAMAADTFEVCVAGIPVGIEDIGKTIFEVKMYPNPTAGKVNVEYHGISREKVEIVVHSATGSEVFRREYLSGEAIRFDLSGEVSGMYLVNIKQGDMLTTKKLILDRK